MGLFDGAGLSKQDWYEKRSWASRQASLLEDNGWEDTLNCRSFASTAHIARLTSSPVLLVVDCSRLSHSIAALVHGYAYFDNRLQIAGVVLNRVKSDRHLDLLQSALESLHIPILGVLRHQDTLKIPDRHLGLVPTAELENLNPLLDQLVHLAETCFDWSRLLPLLKVRPTKFEWEPDSQKPDADSLNHSPENLEPALDRALSLPPSFELRIAIAQDPAFSFYYPDNLDLLTNLGVDLIPWSPLHDLALPDGIQGLYFGGGFPEMFAEQLAANQPARQSVRKAIQMGISTYAECGGLMYLCQQITDFQKRSWPMVGVLPTTAVMGQRLTIGYRKVKALQDELMCKQGAIFWGHEFHRSHLTVQSNQPLFEVSDRRSEHSSLLTPYSLTEGWHLPHLHASYIHFHWGVHPEVPIQFLNHCQQFQKLTIS